eukprot:TRINITY_DN9029_c0_g1_i1.p1 TRINITY_DN9029_c0_g1~~TRINITY_DN9029_c0_g1_i1.p1  ORF type:complete len:265 (-),score=37.32 TRINITY_DN9029_c0_g1_i1:84-878(-)
MGTNSSRIDKTHLQPQGLYPTCQWDLRLLRRLILSKKLAPCTPGTELHSSVAEECPICMLYYVGGLNVTVCCNKGICTECYLQLNPPATASQCPFCNRKPLHTLFKGPRTKEEMDAEEREQQAVIALQIKMQQEEDAREKERLEQRAQRLETGLSQEQRENPPMPEVPATPRPDPQFEETEDLLFQEAIRLSLSEWAPSGPQGSHNDEEIDEELRLAIALSMSLGPLPTETESVADELQATPAPAIETDSAPLQEEQETLPSVS